MSLVSRDKSIMWHPYSQEKHAEPVIPIVKGAGAYLYDDKGQAYLDLISSWWVNLHGHANPILTNAMFEQAMTLDHVLFAGFTHEPAVMLGEQLQTVLPEKLNRFFYSDNGSTAVEIALKMAYQYWKNLGQSQRKIFLSFDGGYHGDTFGAMAVGRKSGFHDMFSELFFEVLTLPFPSTYLGDKTIAQKEDDVLKKLDEILLQRGESIAAFIYEPMVQGASGMQMCRPGFMRKLIKKIREYEILLIADEVMTGFHRTGPFFASKLIHEEQALFYPDFMCLSKGLSGGFLPLALTVTSENIYQAFLGDSHQQAFLHGHTFTANPIACRVALVSLELLKTPEVVEKISQIEQCHQLFLPQLQYSVTCIQNARMQGTIAAFDLDLDSKALDIIKHKFLERKLLIRPIGKTVYLLPPYVVTTEELSQAYAEIASILR